VKITLAYIPGEEPEAAADLAALVDRHPTARIRKSDRHPPFKHIYLAINSTLDCGPPEMYNKANKSTARKG